MFAVIYQWKIKEGCEEDFLLNWEKLTEELKSNHGGLGSCIHKTDENTYLAYARWPSREKWNEQKELKCQNAIEQMNNCIEERLKEVPLEVVDDKLFSAI